MRKILRKVKNFLALLPVSLFFTVAILIAVIWFLRDLVPMFYGTLGYAIMGGLAAIWLIATGIWFWRRRARNKKMVEEIAPEPDPTEVAVSAEQQDLQSKFAGAMRDLSKLRFKSKTGGTRYLYELPWYIFIGPPGAGKTEALKNCGLEFPLQRGEDGSISIDGGAGTRNCDWVFTNDAVFIDTAGRYTTQSSDESVDKAAWTTFLDLLKKFRPREPVNGVIVAISVSELATASKTELDAHAQAIRERLDELCTRMKAQVPIYVMFTKADLLVGFTEFFQAMRQSEREQVWGTTFALDDLSDPEGAINANLTGLEADVDALVGQLGEMQFDRLQEEPDLGARSRIFGFPAQFASLKPVIARFLRQTFAPDRYSTPMVLRGFYFTSATQIGQPVDRLISSMSREFGVEQQAVSTLGRGTGRSYFLSDLLTKVIFPEQGIVTKTARSGRPYGRYAAIAASICLPIAFGAGLYGVYRHNQAQAASFNAAIEGYKADLAGVSIDEVDEHNFASVQPALDRLRAERERLHSDEARAPLLGLGVDDTRVLARRADGAYDTALDTLLRTRLMYLYERKLDRNLHRPGPLYSILKAYLMLAGAGPMDTEFLHNQITAALAQEYDPVIDGERLAALDGHVTALLEDELLAPREIDNELVALARDAVSQITIAERAFRAIESSPEALALAPWRAVDAGGRSTEQVFVRVSGKPLDEPIPGLFTYDGFWGYWLTASAPAAQAALKETWLLADDASRQPDEREIVSQMYQIYYEEYIERWRSLLLDLRVAPFGDTEGAAEILVSVSSSTSPLFRILESAAKETDIAKLPGEDNPIFERLKSVGLNKLAGSGALGRVAAAGVRNSEGGPGSPVSEAFADLRDYMKGSESQQLRTVLKGFYGKISRMQAGGERLTLASQTEEARFLQQESRYAPNYVNDIVSAMVDQVDSASKRGVKARIQEIWTSSVYPACRERVHGRYPFGGGAGIPVGELRTVLGPGGLIDKFFDNELAKYVDTNVTPWRWSPGVGATLGISPDRLAFFERARQLRDAFFPNGSPDPRVSIAVYPVNIDPGVAAARLSIGGSVASFTSAEDSPSQLLWPGTQPANGADGTLSITGVEDLTTGETEAEDLSLGEPGLWGLFQLIDKIGINMRGAGDTGRIRIAIGGRSATFELRMDSTVNPLALRREMPSFRCPASL